MPRPFKWAEYFNKDAALQNRSNKYQVSCVRCHKKIPKGRSEERTRHLVDECTGLTPEEREQIIRVEAKEAEAAAAGTPKPRTGKTSKGGGVGGGGGGTGLGETEIEELLRLARLHSVEGGSQEGWQGITEEYNNWAESNGFKTRTSDALQKQWYAKYIIDNQKKNCDWCSTGIHASPVIVIVTTASKGQQTSHGTLQRPGSSLGKSVRSAPLMRTKAAIPPLTTTPLQQTSVEMAVVHHQAIIFPPLLHALTPNYLHFAIPLRRQICRRRNPQTLAKGGSIAKQNIHHALLLHHRHPNPNPQLRSQWWVSLTRGHRHHWSSYCNMRTRRRRNGSKGWRYGKIGCRRRLIGWKAGTGS